MIFDSRKRRLRIRARHYEQEKLAGREIVLLALVTLVGGLAIYTSQDMHSSFGLAPNAAHADVTPVIISFRTDTLIDQPILELDVTFNNTNVSQVHGVLVDPTDPPPVEELSALNTRVGGEVALFWTRPEVTSSVNIYRRSQTANNLDDFTLILEKTTQLSHIDVDLKQDQVYEYRAVAVMSQDGQDYESKDYAVAIVQPIDEIPPHAPTDVSVDSGAKKSGNTGLQITWVNPQDDDFSYLEIYRSSYMGNRGEKIATVKKGTESYVDVEADTNIIQYYTVVAYDMADNGSSKDFQIPQAGNPTPFLPFSGIKKTQE